VLKQLGNQGAPLPAEWDRAEIAASSEPAVTAMARRLGVRPDCFVNESDDTASLPTSALTAGFVRMLNAAQASGANPGTVTAGVGTQGFAGQGTAAIVFGKE
jgi:hypothetical protein